MVKVFHFELRTVCHWMGNLFTRAKQRRNRKDAAAKELTPDKSNAKIKGKNRAMVITRAIALFRYCPNIAHFLVSDTSAVNHAFQSI